MTDKNQQSKYFSSHKVSDVIQTRVEGILYIVVNMSNPNGDPNNEGLPRTTPDGLGLISPQSIKRKWRDTLVDMFGSHIYYAKQAVLESVTKTFLEMKKRKVADFKGNAGFDEFANMLCEEFADVRLFGCTHTAKPIGRITGPVVITNAVSSQPVQIVHMGITRSSVSSDKDGTTDDEKAERAKHAQIGNVSVVKHGLYPAMFYVNPAQAEYTGMTWGDLDNMIDAALRMYQNNASAARPDVVVERVDLWEHSSRNGACLPLKLPKATIRNIKADCDLPKSIADYTIRVDMHDDVEYTKVLFDNNSEQQITAAE